jgi:hypothetical protein
MRTFRGHRNLVAIDPDADMGKLSNGVLLSFPPYTTLLSGPGRGSA